MKKVKYFGCILFVCLLTITGCGKKEQQEIIDKKDNIKTVSSIIDAKYDDIVYSDGYFYALTGDELTGTITFFKDDGKKLGTLNLSKLNPAVLATLDFEEFTDNYYIASYLDTATLDTIYVANSYSGKEIKTASDMEVINNDYFLITSEVDDEDTDIICTNKGKKVFTNVDDVSVYDDKYIYFKQNGVSKIINNKGKEILSGYKISEVITDENDNVKYMIIRSDADNVYNYFDVKTNSKKGDAFTYYNINDDANEVTITKSVNSKSTKFLLKDNGEQVEYNDEEVIEENVNYYEKIKDKIDLNKYSVFEATVKSENQNYILVNNDEENKFGILDIEKGEFTELGTYKANSSKRLILDELVNNTDFNDVIFSISCSKYYCDYETQYIYNFTTNELIVSRGENETMISNIYIYENNIVIYNSSSNNEDSSMYLLIDKNKDTLLESKNYIELLGEKVKSYLGTPKTTGNINLYDLSSNKVLNASENNIYSINSMKIADKQIRYYNADNSINLISDDGKVSSIEGKYQDHDETGLYIVNNKELIYYNVYNQKTSSYTLKDNESNNGANGKEIKPYRSTFFINNSYDMTFKIVDSENKNLISKKDLQIYKTYTRLDGSVLIYVQNKNNKLGVYVAK